MSEKKYTLDDLIDAVLTYNSNKIDTFGFCSSPMNDVFWADIGRHVVGLELKTCVSTCENCPLFIKGREALKKEITKALLVKKNQDGFVDMARAIEKIICVGNCSLCKFATLGTSNSCKLREIRNKFTNSSGNFYDTEDIKKYINQVTVVVVETINSLNNREEING